MKCQPAPMMTELALELDEDACGDVCGVYVSESKGNTGTLQIIVYAKTRDGRFVVGKTTTRAAAAHVTATSRLVAIACVPGVIGWSATVIGSSVAGDKAAEVFLSAAEAKYGVAPGLTVFDGGTLDAL